MRPHPRDWLKALNVHGHLHTNPAPSFSWSRRAWLQDPRFVGEHDGLDTVAELKLLQQVPDMRLDGRLAHIQFRRNFCVGEAARHQFQDSSSLSVSC